MWKRQFTPSHPQIFQRVLSFRYINLWAFHSSFVTKSMPLILLLGFFSKPRMSQYPCIISWSCFESCWCPCTGPRGFHTQPGCAGRCWKEGGSFFLFLSFFPHWLQWIWLELNKFNTKYRIFSWCKFHTFVSKADAAFHSGNFPAILGIHNLQVLKLECPAL